MSTPDYNLFMMCKRLNSAALSEVPQGYHARFCRRDELPLWRSFPFDSPAPAAEYDGYMAGYFDRVYAPHGNLFFQRCLFLCDGDDRPVATCFTWQVYGRFQTIHWFKTLRTHEGRGLGRAVLSEALRRLAPADYPVYLHTQTSSHRAIKLYTDFGFSLLTDGKIGRRENGLTQSLPILKERMPPDAFARLRFEHSDGLLSRAAAQCEFDAF